MSVIFLLQNEMNKLYILIEFSFTKWKDTELQFEKRKCSFQTVSAQVMGNIQTVPHLKVKVISLCLTRY